MSDFLTVTYHKLFGNDFLNLKILYCKKVNAFIQIYFFLNGKQFFIMNRS